MVKPRVVRTCKTLDCERRGVETDVTDEPLPGFCPACHLEADVIVRYGSLESDSVATFFELAAASARECALLDRLASAGMAEESDLLRREELKRQLNGLECSCCGQPILASPETAKPVLPADSSTR